VVNLQYADLSMRLPLLLVTLAVYAPLSQCCSYVEVPVKASSYKVIARTMELASGSNNWEVTTYPRNATSAFVREGFGFISVDALLKHDILHNVRVPTEGMNEWGLTMSAQTLRESLYQSATNKSGPHVTYYEVLPLVLRRANSVPEALGILEGLVVIDTPLLEGLEGGLHWAIADATGGSAVVAYLDGKLNVWNNTVGVMTNDPPFPWQIQYLNTFVSLQSSWPIQDKSVLVESAVNGQQIPRAVGHGWNLAGLPGDSSPPSRFVRLFYLRQFALAAEQVATASDAIIVATGLLNNVHLIRGTVARAPHEKSYEFTPFAVLKIPQDRKFLFRSYSNMQWNQIDLAKIDFEQGDSIVRWEIHVDDINIADVTKQFRPQ